MISINIDTQGLIKSALGNKADSGGNDVNRKGSNPFDVAHKGDDKGGNNQPDIVKTPLGEFDVNKLFQGEDIPDSHTIVSRAIKESAIKSKEIVQSEWDKLMDLLR